MNKLFTKIAALALGAAMVVGVGVSVGSKSKVSAAEAADATTTMTWGGTTTQWSFSDNGDTYLEWSHASTGTTPIQAADYRMYSGADLTVKAKSAYASSVKIKSLAIKGASSKNTNVLYYNPTTGAKVTSAGDGVTELSWTTSTSTQTADFGDGLASVTVARATSGNQVRVTEIVVTYSVTTSKTLSSIAITTGPTKTSYRVGEAFDPAGMVVTATFSDSSTDNTVASSCTFSPSTIASDTSKVTVSYTYGATTKTADQSITLITPTGITEGGDMTNKTYAEGDSWDLSGLYLTVSWSGGASSTTVYVSSLTKDTDYLLSDDNPVAGHTTLDIEGEYLGFGFEFNITGITVSEHPLADTLDASSIPSAAIGSSTSSWGAWTEVTDYTYSQSATNGAKYQVRLMGPSSGYVGRMNNSANGGFYTSKAPVGVRIKSVSFSAIAESKDVSLYVSNTEYESLPLTTDYVATLTSENLSYTVEGNYTCLAIRGRSSSLDVGALTIEYESLDPVIEFEGGASSSSLTVVNGSTNSVTFEAKNFSSVSADLFSCSPASGSHSTLAFSVSGTTVTATATGTSIGGPDSYTISATGCSNTLTLDVTVQSSTTFDSLVISTATSATVFNEDDPFAVTDMVVTANFTVGGSATTEKFSADSGADHPLSALTFTVGGNAIEIGDPLTSTGSLSVVVSYTDSVTGTTQSATAYGITVNAYVAHTWTKVTTAPNDWRGTYLLGYENSGTFYAFNSSLTTFDATFNNVNTTSISSDVVTGSKELDAVAVKIERNTVSGTSYYHAKCANGEYLKSASKSINHQATATAAVAVTFDGVSLKIGDYWLRFNSASDQLRFRFGDSTYLSSSTASLYKMDTTSAITSEVNGYATSFLSNVTCSGSGSIVNDGWSDMSTAFAGLSVDAQGILANTVGDDSGSGVAGAVGRYDEIVVKHGDDHADFMNRFIEGAINYGRIIPNSNPLNVFTSETRGTVIIIIVSVIGVSALGGFFFLRKRKEI